MGVGAGSEALADVRARVARTSEELGERLRLLVGKPGLDGHSNGAEQIAVRARDAGFEVVYQGIRLTPEQIVGGRGGRGRAPASGISILSGSHMELVPEVLERMREAGAGDVPVIVGGIIPDADAARLKALGVAEVFTPKDFGLNDIMGASSRSSGPPRASPLTPRRPPTPERGRASRRATRRQALTDADSAAVSSRVNAGRSSGLRLVTRLSSTTTSSSTHSAPALRRSVCRLGHDVRLRPRTTSASTSVHGAWQIAATGLPDSTNCRTNATASLVRPQRRRGWRRRRAAPGRRSRRRRPTPR